MKHLRRSLKYLIQISLLFIVIIGGLMLSGMVSKDVAIAFRHGWTSIAWIAGLFVVMSAIYPFFGYGKRNIRIAGDPAQLWPQIQEALKSRGYVEAGETEEGRCFHLSSPINRAARMWEDTITITPVLGGFQAEGLVRDLSRVVMTIDHKLNNYGN